jgi:YD repeat-containing protein
VGNLEQVTAAGQTVDYDYLADRVVSRTSNPSGPLLEVMVYDHQGRLTSRRDPSGTTETEGFAYDVEDQLKQVRRSGAVAEVLEYDPLEEVALQSVQAWAREAFLGAP